MKLVFIIDSTKHIGGGEYAQFMFAKGLAQKGHNVTIFSGDTNFLSDDLQQIKNLHMFYRHIIPQFAKKIGIGVLNRVWANLYYTKIITKKIKNIQPDYIIGYLRDSAKYAQVLGKKNNIPIVNFIFETPLWMEHVLQEKWQKELENKTFAKSWQDTKIVYANSDILIPNSILAGVWCKKWIQTANISKPVYPGIDITKIPKPIEQQTISKIKNSTQTQNKQNTKKENDSKSKQNTIQNTTKTQYISNNKNNIKKYDIVYVGRLNTLKHIDELLLACAQIKRKLHICIMGSGEEEQYLKQLAKENNLSVTFTGAVSDEEKWNTLHQSSLLVFPTSFEGFGMPPLEAIACGCNVLCSDLEIFKEVYGNNSNYFKLHDISDLAKKIELCLDGKMPLPPSAKMLLKKYTWDNAITQIEEILHEAKQ